MLVWCGWFVVACSHVTVIRALVVLLASATLLGASGAMAQAIVLTSKVDQSRLQACASEAVRWSLLQSDFSETILVDGSSKFRHIRVDGYARHWDYRVWAFVSAPVNPETGTNSVTFGYVDPATDVNSRVPEQKKQGMHTVLERCLKGAWDAKAPR